VTVDNKMFLWKFTESSIEICDIYDELKEIIVTVALSVPKPGVFKDSVKYVLVIATAIEIILLAITCDSVGNGFKINPTAYKLCSDNIVMTKIVSTQNGRIFMIGNDNKLYELDYHNTDDDTWMIFSNSNIRDGNHHHKCRKINHFTWSWKLLNILPPFVQSFFHEENNNLIALTIDNLRNTLYVITTNGNLTVFYLGVDNNETNCIIESYNIFYHAKKYLTSTTSSSSVMGSRISDNSLRADSFTNNITDGFYVLSIHVISILESKKVHLVVILGNGIRIYLSLLTSSSSSNIQNKFFDKLPTKSSLNTSSQYPTDIQIAYIKIPPSMSDLRALRSHNQHHHHPSNPINNNYNLMNISNSCNTSFVSSQALNITTSFYSHGITLLSQDKSIHPDEVIGIYEDLICRSSLLTGLAPSYQLPNMREGINVILDETRNRGKVFDIKEYIPQFHSIELMKLRSLYAHSMTPSINLSIKDESHHRDLSSSSSSSSTINNSSNNSTTASSIGSLPFFSSWLQDNSNNISSSSSRISEVPVVYGSTSLSMAAKPSGIGYDVNNLDHLCLLGEVSYQHVPCISSSIQRQILILSTHGVHVYKKLRPCDILYQQLVHINNTSSSSSSSGGVGEQQFFESFFMFYGPLESSTMCFAIACGLPSDCSTGSSISSSSISNFNNVSEVIQMKAIQVVFNLTKGPYYYKDQAVGGVGSNNNNIIRDIRLAPIASIPEFYKSIANDALYLLTSRILRPIWLRPLIKLNKKIDNNLWTYNSTILTGIKLSLLKLRRILYHYFSSSIRIDPHSSKEYNTVNHHHQQQQQQQQQTATMNNMNDESNVTRIMLEKSSNSINYEQNLFKKAKLLDDLSINELYRLITRIIQALSFLDLLLYTSEKYHISILWSKLGCISFKTFVISSNIYDNIKFLLFDFINNIKLTNHRDVLYEVMNKLTKTCYYYFTKGDYCLYESTLIYDKIQLLTTQSLSLSSSSSSVTSDSNQEIIDLSYYLIKLLLQVTKYWTNVNHVDGNESILSQQCSKLLLINNNNNSCSVICRNGIVDLCLETAKNFDTSSISSTSSTIVDDNINDDGDDDDSCTWEQQLYKESIVLNDAEKISTKHACYICLINHIMTVGDIGNQSSNSSNTASSIGGGNNNSGNIISGASSSSSSSNSSSSINNNSSSSIQKNMFDNSSLDIVQKNMFDMLSRAIQNSTDALFYNLLGDRLIRDNYHEQLIALFSPYIEQYLKNKDVNLLYR
jgi:hypothetical protein